ncbi:MAG: hypothetical protein V2B18_20235 [Pseudomonadota bacterium]
MTWEQEKRTLAGEILALLYQHRMIRTFYRDKPEGWTLVSGLYSPMYIQLRPLASHPDLFRKVCAAMSRMIREEAPETARTIGIAMAGVPIAAGICVAGGIPAAFTRKMENVKSIDEFRRAVESYGEHSLVEGEFEDGERVALVDDLVTRFGSKLVALEQVKHEIRKRGISDLRVDTVAVVLDREQGGREEAQKASLRLLSLIPFKSVGLPLLKSVMHPQEWDVLARYLDDPEQFQGEAAREEVRRKAAAEA